MLPLDRTAALEWMLQRSRHMSGITRPWCCPEPRCTPIHNDQVQEEPTPGDSFICFGQMAEPVAFSYDGVEHTNDLNHCDYTPLKGLIRWQENADDWQYVITQYSRAKRKLEAG